MHFGPATTRELYANPLLKGVDANIICEGQGQVPQVLGNPRAASPGPPKTIKIIDFNKKMGSGADASDPREP